jgi:hypothetical protein
MSNDANQNGVHTSGRRSCLWGGITLAAVVVLVPSCVALIRFGAYLVDFGGNEFAEIDPAKGFSQLTSWQLPEQAQVLTNTYTHSGFKNDGDYTLVVRMSPTHLQSLVANDPHVWVSCPVAPEIARLAALPQHSGDLYYAERTRESDADWHRGHVVIVNREMGMVWIYEWKW